MTPPLPAGYKLDQGPQGPPPLPPGYQLDAPRGNLDRIPKEQPVPGLLSGEYSAPLTVGNQAVQSTVAPGETLPHAVARQAIGGVGSAVKGMAGMVKDLVAPPDDTLQRTLGPGASLVRPQIEEGKQAVRLAKQGEYARAAGHGLAAAVPFVGPMIAEATEKASTGTVGPAAELATYAAAPKVAKETAKLAAPAVEGAANLAGKAADRNWEQVLGATTKKLKAIASDKLIPELRDRGITANSREGLSKIAEEGVKKHGAEVDAAIQRHTASGVELQTAPLIQDLEAIKNQYRLRSAKTGRVTASRAAPINRINEAQATLKRYGATIRPDDLVEVRRFLDEGVSKKKMAFLADDTKGFEGEAEEAASNALRSRINEEFPDLAAANDEFTFHKNLQTVTDATIKRTASQSKLMGRALKGATGAYVGSQFGRLVGAPEVGGVLGASADLLHDTPAYRTRAAALENRFASRFGTPQNPPPGSPGRPSIKVFPNQGAGGPNVPRGTPPPGAGTPPGTGVSPSPAGAAPAPGGNVQGVQINPQPVLPGRQEPKLLTAPPNAALGPATEEAPAKPKLFVGRELASQLAKQGFSKEDIATLSPDDLERIKSSGETKERRVYPRAEAFSAVAFEKFLGTKGMDRAKFSALSPEEKGNIIGEFGNSGMQTVQGIKPTGTPVEAPGLPSGRITRMNVSDIHADPERFQHRMEPTSSGILEAKEYNEQISPVITAWDDPADGKTYTLNHHRLFKAREVGKDQLNVFHVDAKDANEAMAIGALQNIADDTASPLDVARLLRGMDAPMDKLAQNGIVLKGKNSSVGAGLAKLDDYHFNRLAMSGTPQELERGAAVGEATSNPTEQDAIFKQIADREKSGKKITPDVLKEAIRLTVGGEQVRATERNLFGEQEMTRSLAFEKGEVSDFVKKQLSREKSTFGSLKTERKAGMLSKAGNILNIQENAKIAAQAAQDLDIYDKFSNKSGRIADILDQAARELAAGGNADAIKTKAFEAIRPEIQKALAGSTGAGDPGNQALDAGGEEIGSTPRLAGLK